ncbi:MAG: hypothetical protein ACOH5I_09520 [Oligoflexus sp.]
MKWNRRKDLFFGLVFGILSLTACQEHESSDLQWGHLANSGLNPQAPQFLINQKPDDSYRVCLPEYLADELPGISSEIIASINIWAHYLGREIAVEILQKNLAKPDKSQSSDMLRASYYAECGDDIDLVVGLSPLPGGAVGQTGSSWMTNFRGEVVRFQRHLVLRDFNLSPDPYGRQQSWISLQDLTGESLSAEQLLQNMIERDRLELDPRGRSLALPVLVHEFGHVWGLCDQYEGPSNCDHQFSSAHPDFNSIMAASSSISKLYLTDDDITGLRELARRDGFSAAWPDSRDALNVPPIALSEEEIQVLRISDIVRQGRQLQINFSALTQSAGGELNLNYRQLDQENWQTARSYFPSRQAFRIVHQSFALPLDGLGQNFEFRLALRLRDAAGKLGAPVYSEIFRYSDQEK